MLGLMQKHALTISAIIDFAERNHGLTEIISKRVEGDLHRTHWREVAERSKKVAAALDQAGIQRGSRVATLAWNGYRHLELYFGISASGRILHTVNPRLHPDQIAWIIGHAEDEVVCFDLSFVPIIQAIHSFCPNVRKWVALCDEASLPCSAGLPSLVSYESWIHPHASTYEWPTLDENEASSLCYTSGTTGDPKGVLYSHRSTVLHAYAAALPDVLGLSARDSVLPVVPMFHVNAWGIPYSSALVGSKLVLPGPALDGKSLFELIEQEGVTLAAGVPTIWQGLLTYIQSHRLRFSQLKRTIVGGAACPATLMQAFQKDLGVEVLHAWGMTELSPLGTLNSLKHHQTELPPQDQEQLRTKQGRPCFGVEIEIFDDQGHPLPHDGKTYGHLMARGHWVMDRYFGLKNEVSAYSPQGWFPTGDVATIDSEGFMQITDRSKDVIKSGGEWISSIELENIAMGHPSVQLAACIGVKHPKWDERPVIVVMKKPGEDLAKEDVLSLYANRVSKWQIPDDVIFLDSIPIGATGKMQKNKIREQLTQLNSLSHL